MAVVITIAGVTKTVKKGSLRISQTANGRTTASFAVLSTDGSYRAALDAEAIVTEGGTRILGGLIDHPSEKGLLQGASAAIETSVNVVDFNAYAERRFVNETIVEGTLKAALTTLVANYLTGYGVTLDAGQVTGPTLPELTYDYRKMTEVLDELATLTADAGEPFVWRIDAFKVLRMYQPSTTAAPFDIIGNAPSEVMGDIEVEETRDQYANRIIVKTPSKTEMNRVETFTGDGATTAFPLQYTLFASRGYVTSAGVFETLAILPATGGTWSFDPDTNTLTRGSAPAAGATITFAFDGTFTGQGLAEDAGEIASVGIWEKVVSVDSVPSDTTAQALAEAYLARSLPVTKKVKYRTLQTGLTVGQTQTITVPRRNIDVTAAISDIVIRDFDPRQLARDVTAIIDAAQTNLGRGWRDVYKQWSGDKSGASTAIAAATTPGTGTPPGGPAGPDTAGQFNNAGVFGGSGQFTFDDDTDCMLVGGGGSSITAGDPRSCQVFGYNNHITDP